MLSRQNNVRFTKKYFRKLTCRITNLIFDIHYWSSFRFLNISFWYLRGNISPWQWIPCGCSQCFPSTWQEEESTLSSSETLPPFPVLLHCTSKTRNNPTLIIRRHTGNRWEKIISLFYMESRWKSNMNILKNVFFFTLSKWLCFYTGCRKKEHEAIALSNNPFYSKIVNVEKNQQHVMYMKRATKLLFVLGVTFKSTFTTNSTGRVNAPTLSVKWQTK